MIEVDHLTKYYGPRAAIDDLSFTVDRGEVLGFLGPNGAGKTTTMRILTGFIAASAGTARIGGDDVSRDSLRVRRRLGYLPESVPLYGEMSVRGYLDFMARLKGVPRARRADALNRVLEVTATGPVRDELISRLSKGYRQRVGLAQALIHDPEVLILDEPTAGLDPRQIIETRHLIKELGKERTVILSTHILPEVSMTCTRVVIINEGRLVAVDRPDQLAVRLRHALRVTLEVSGRRDTLADSLKGIDGVRHVEVTELAEDGRLRLLVEAEPGRDIRDQLARVVVNGGWGLYQLGLERVTLEDVFLRLTTREPAPEEPGAPAGEAAPG
jgi:ABC-2 type transport system ATP-binding protein